MGAIRHTSSGQTRILQPSHVVGRAPAPQSCLTLDQRYVSAVHAEFRWTGSAWELRDLGSKNGTYLDGRRLAPSVPHRIRRDSQIAIGAAEEEWIMVDDSPPQAMVVPFDGGDPIVLSGDLLPLPSSDDPRATIYRTSEGGWALESPDDGTVALGHLQTFEAAGRVWRLSCAEMSTETLAAPGGPAESGFRVGDLQLYFAVSQDEETVHLQVTCGTRDFDLGTRQFYYLLVTLARLRLKEKKEGLPEPSCGWQDQDDLARDPSMAPPQLNLAVFRIRDQFARIGVIDAAAIVERRPRQRQLRIGTDRISVRTE